MAKELPYFQFEPAEYLTKDVSFCSLSAQGLFINICSYYWQRQCELTKGQLLRRLNYPKELEELIDEGVLKIQNEAINIAFLDQQFEKATLLKKTNSVNGSKGGRIKLDTELTALDGKIIPREVNKDDHFLYLFKRKSTGTYKIGETQDLFKRRGTIKIPSSDLSIIHFVMIDKSVKLEIESHIKVNFKSNHINGDWFDFKTSEIANVIEFMEAEKANKKQLDSELKGIREEKRREEEIKEDKISFSQRKKKFLDWFNKQKKVYTKKEGKFKTLSTADEKNLKKLLDNYETADFQKAIPNLFKNKWAEENGHLSPSHFLRVENFNKYLNMDGQNKASDGTSTKMIGNILESTKIDR
jgi:hypothetical protein